MTAPLKVKTAIAATALAVPMIAAWEGVKHVPYVDIVGVPTVCYGHTSQVVPGRRYSQAECMRLLALDAVDHGVSISNCITTDVPKESMAAFVSLAFNIGKGAFCRSTLVRRLNDGDLAGACAEISRWVFAGGKRVRGLENRRADERAFCEQGLA